MASKGVGKIGVALLILCIISQFYIASWASPMEDKTLDLSNEEKEYIRTRGTVKVSSLDNSAPLHYVNSKGEKQGIAMSFLTYIEETTGLVFQVNFYNSVIDTLEGDSEDITIAATPKYAPKNMTLSDPFLSADTVLFLRKGLSPNDLKDKIYANVEGGSLLDGISKDNTIDFSSRLETLEAVESGQADYGYGNEYSVTFYNIQKGYKNIVTVPISKELREYSVGFIKEDPILLSIINKSIASIDGKQLEKFILEMATNIERDISPQMVFDSYGGIIVICVIFVIGVLIWGILVNIRYKRQVELQNEKLIEKNMLDGLMDIYNTATTRELIINRIKEKDLSTKDALIIFDCDKFKNINDNYGHLAGDRALEHVGKILKSTFRYTDIIGRVGGDEFCVYIKNIPSDDFVYHKCNRIMDLTAQLNEEFQLTLSIGIKIVSGSVEFKEIFHQADQAMYEVKRQGGNAISLVK